MVPKSSYNIVELDLPGVLLITSQVRSDERGFSISAYDADEFSMCGITTKFVMDYISYSKKDVIRGLHFQTAPYAQDKLIRCATGRVFDVVADYEPTSRTFKTFVQVELNSEKGEMLFVPGKYAHGFCVLSDEGALIEYKMSEGYHPESAGGIRFDDPLFAIPWPVANPILSTQDKEWPLFPLTRI